MIAVVNFTNGEKNVAIETFFTGTFHKHLVFIKRKKKKKEQIKKEREIYPLLIFKSFSILFS